MKMTFVTCRCGATAEDRSCWDGLKLKDLISGSVQGFSYNFKKPKKASRKKLPFRSSKGRHQQKPVRNDRACEMAEAPFGTQRRMSTRWLPDVNIWLARCIPQHVHHPVVMDWMSQHDDPLYFCRASQQGPVRLLTTSAVLAPYRTSPAQQSSSLVENEGGLLN